MVNCEERLKINESYYLLGLMDRDAEAKHMKKIFSPSWLRDKSLIPLLEAINEFIDKHSVTPSLLALHEYLEDKEKDKYIARFKSDLDQLGLLPKDASMMQVSIGKAKQLAKTLSFEELIHSQRTQGIIANGEGDLLREDLVRWVAQHNDEPDEDKLYDFGQAVDKLLADNPIQGKPSRLQCGIQPVDEWSSGGLRPGQLGILLAPTGHGKSALLMMMAWYVAAVLQEPVLLLTNELSIGELTERLLVRMQRPEIINGKLTYHGLHQVQDDPYLVIKGLDHKITTGLPRRLVIKSIPLSCTATDVEQILRDLKLERGMVPKCVVIDYMERMAPQHTYKGDHEWERYGQIARELEWTAKRRKFLCWTAVQTNRAGLNPDLPMSLQFAQGSIRHLQTAASVVGTRKIKIPLDKKGNADVLCQEFAELKQRGSEMSNRQVYLRSELRRMYITDEVVEKASDDQTIEVEEGDEDGATSKRSKPRNKPQQKR